MKRFVIKVRSLRSTLLMIVLLCWLVPTIFLGVVVGSQFLEALDQKTQATLLTTTQQAEARLCENLDALISLAKDAVYDDEIAQAVDAFWRDEISYDLYFATCKSYLERQYGREVLLDFALFFCYQNPEDILYTDGDFESATHFSNALLTYALDQKDTLGTNNHFVQIDGQVFLMRNLLNVRLETIGMLVLGINQEQLLAPVKDLADQLQMDYALQLDAFQIGDDILWDLPLGVQWSEPWVLCTTQSIGRDYELRFRLMAQSVQVYQEHIQFRNVLIWMFFLVVPLCLAITYFVKRRISTPIHNLSIAAKRIRGGELGVTVPVVGNDELSHLGHAFSDMSLQLMELVDKSYKEEILLRDARIQALQSRINSHFLNNALETINWEARIEGSETIAEMVEALSCLLNATMDRREQHIVPLQEELSVSDAYFFFVGLRFGEKLTVFQEISPDLQYLAIPRLMIQTLLENAIEHGIAPMGGGRIHLTIFTRYEKLFVQVRNTGKRLSADDLSRVRKLMNDEDSPSDGHMGIRNVSKRLSLLYGKDANIQIDVDEHSLTVVTLMLPAKPFMKGEQEHDP